MKARKNHEVKSPPKAKDISIDSIVGLQLREAISKEAIADYAACIDDLPPIEVVQDSERPTTFYAIDGNHRLEAHKKEGRTTIKAVVTSKGTRADAVIAAAGANKRNGLRRSSEDKHRCVEAVLNDDRWFDKPARAIADHVGVSHEFVRQIKLSLINGLNEPPDQPDYIDIDDSKREAYQQMHDCEYGLLTPSEVRQLYAQLATLSKPSTRLEEERFQLQLTKQVNDAEENRVWGKLLRDRRDAGEDLQPFADNAGMTMVRISQLIDLYEREPFPNDEIPLELIDQIEDDYFPNDDEAAQLETSEAA